MELTAFIQSFVFILVTILQIAIIGRSVISWFPVDPRSPLVSILHEVTEPILAPLRRIVPRVGMFDLTPMAAIFILYFISQVVSSSV